MITIQHRPGLITVSGHSGYAPPRQDIVCAAISTLTQTLVASLVELTDDEIQSVTFVTGVTLIRAN